MLRTTRTESKRYYVLSDMENKKQVCTSPFDHLFGPKDPSSSSKNGIFGTIFPTPAMVLGRKSIGSGEQSHVTTAPCNLCSSIHYGGQENYSSLNTTTTDSLSYLKKDEEDDFNGSNSSGASRGNWWQVIVAAASSMMQKILLLPWKLAGRELGIYYRAWNIAQN